VIGGKRMFPDRLSERRAQANRFGQLVWCQPIPLSLRLTPKAVKSDTKLMDNAFDVADAKGRKSFNLCSAYSSGNHVRMRSIMAADRKTPRRRVGC
jgi:hypothetical protein